MWCRLLLVGIGWYWLVLVGIGWYWLVLVGWVDVVVDSFGCRQSRVVKIVWI